MPAETHSRGAPLDARAVATVVADRLVELLGLDQEPGAEATLRDDLGLDDLTLLDVVEAIESDLGERSVGSILGDEDLDDLVTVGDLVACVQVRVAPHPEPSARPGGYAAPAPGREPAEPGGPA